MKLTKLFTIVFVLEFSNLIIETEAIHVISFMIYYLNPNSRLHYFMLHRESEKYKTEAARLRKGFESMWNTYDVQLFFNPLRFEPSGWGSHKVNVLMIAVSEKLTHEATVEKVMNVYGHYEMNSFMAREIDDRFKHGVVLIDMHAHCESESTGIVPDIKIQWPATSVNSTVHAPCSAVGTFHPNEYAVRSCLIVPQKTGGSIGKWSGNIDYSRCGEPPTNLPCSERNRKDITETNVNSLSQEVLAFIDGYVQGGKYFPPRVIQCVALLLENLSMKVDLIPTSSTSSINVLSSINKLITSYASHFDTFTLHSLRQDIKNVAIRTPLNNGSFHFMSSNIALTVESISWTDPQDMAFYEIYSMDNRIGIQLLTSNQKADDYKMLHTWVRVPMKAILESLSNLQKQRLYRVGVTTFTNAGLFGQLRNSSKTEIVSRVITVIIPDTSIKHLVKNITLNYIHKVKQNPDRPQCVSWHPLDHIEDGLGHWVGEGCKRLITRDDSTMCKCNHLASYALQFDVFNQTESDNMHKPWSFVAVTGCMISLMALALTFLAHALFSHRSLMTPKIMFNLALSLAVVNMSIILEDVREITYDYTGCKILAVTLHYSLLSTLTWMGVEWCFMYLSLWKFLRLDSPYWLLFKLSLFGWGVPLLVVTPTILDANWDNYGRDRHGMCWLTTSPTSRLAEIPFNVPFVLLLSFNHVMCAFACQKLSNLIEREEFEDVVGREMAVQRLRAAFAILILQDLNGMFGFLSIGKVLSFSYAFCICDFTLAICVYVLWFYSEFDSVQTKSITASQIKMRRLHE